MGCQSNLCVKYIETIILFRSLTTFVLGGILKRTERVKIIILNYATRRVFFKHFLPPLVKNSIRIEIPELSS